MNSIEAASSSSATAWLAAAPKIASGRSSEVTNRNRTRSAPMLHACRAVISASSYSGRAQVVSFGTTKATR